MSNLSWHNSLQIWNMSLKLMRSFMFLKVIFKTISKPSKLYNINFFPFFIDYNVMYTVLYLFHNKSFQNGIYKQEFLNF